MNQWLLFGLIAAAVGLPLLIHLLNRGSAKVVEVSSLKLFVLADKPRWRRLLLTQRTLLLVRVISLCALLFAAARLFSVGDSEQMSGDVVAVVPGASEVDVAKARDLPGSGVWLDDALTDLSTDSGSTQTTLRARLTRLDRAMGEQATLTIVGPLNAQAWGVALGSLSRVPTMLQASPLAADFSPQALPPLYYAGSDERVAAALTAALARWQQAGFVADELITIDSPAQFEWPQHDAWLVSDSDLALPLATSAGHVQVTISTLRDGDEFVLRTADQQHGDLQGYPFASRLFLALLGERATTPAVAASVAPLPAISAAPTTSIAMTQVAQLPLWLVYMLLALVCIERVLAVWLGARR